MSRRDGKAILSADEIVGAIQRSNLPTLITEGKDDVLLFRHFEEELGFDLIPAGSRTLLLKIFERIEEFANKNVVFLADKDIWVTFGVPDKYRNARLVFTDGYSIENDVYYDADYERLLCQVEKNNLLIERDVFIKWYAVSINRQNNGIEGYLSTNPIALFGNANFINEPFCLNEGEEFPQSIYEKVSSDPIGQIRGKSLISLLSRHLDCQDREPRHRVSTKIFIELAIKDRGQKTIKLLNDINEAFDNLNVI